MKRTLLFLPLLALSHLGSAHTVHCQSVIPDSNGVAVGIAVTETPMASTSVARMGKDLPALATTPESGAVRPCKKEKKVRKKDKREVTVVIGHSVDNYLSTLYTVHSLQRF